MTDTAATPPTDDQRPTERLRLLREAGHEPFLEDFQIVKPSLNYLSNSRTFSYRLSELVFGSLLASYVVGFVGFVAAHTQPARAIDLGILTRVGSGGDWILILQYLTTSILFSVYTALIYFNYHQSIMYLSSDQRNSSSDFILAVAIGVSFGLSMAFPLTTVFFIGCLILGVLLRKRTLVLPYWVHLADELQLLPRRSDPSQQHLRADLLARISRALLSNSNPVLSSWGSLGGAQAGFGGALMVGGPIVVFAITNLPELSQYPNLHGLSNWMAMLSPAVHLGLCIVLTYLLYRTLKVATRAMPSVEEGGGKIVDESLNDVLKTIRDQWRLERGSESPPSSATQR